MENQGYSLEALLKHVRSLRKSNKLSIAKSSAWLTACQGVISCLAPEEQMDVRTIDLDRALDVFRGSRPELANRTLTEYRGRMRAAIASLVTSSQTLNSISTAGSEALSANPDTTENLRKKLPMKRRMTSTHTLNIPLRPDFVAQFIIPYDIKPVEAKRICKVLEVLATDNEDL